MFKINFSRQTAPAAETVSVDPISHRETFTMDVSELTVIEILQTLRADTIDFAEDNGLTWAASDFVIRNIPLRVKLTENWDLIYVFDGETLFSIKDAAAFIQAQAVQF